MGVKVDHLTPELAHYLENHEDGATHFSQTDLDNYNSALDKMRNTDSPGERHVGVSPDPQSKFGWTDEEQAAYSKYAKLEDEWKTRDISGFDHNSYESQKENYGRDGDGIKGPSLNQPVAGGADGGKADLVVNTAALRTFRQNLDPIKAAIEKVRDLIGEVDVKPGTFGSATFLRGQIMDDGKLQKTTYNFLSAAGNAVVHLQAEIDAAIKTYRKSEEMNDLTVDDLSKTFGQSFKDIDSFRSAK